MAQCWYCGKVKGRRSCPARGGELICTKCCGTHRGVTIRCPSDCPYLHGTHDRKWVSESREKEAARFFAPIVALEERIAAFYLFLLHLMNAPRSPLRTLVDDDLLEVSRTASRTIATLSKGVLYSHPAEKAHLQPAAEWLLKLVAARKKIRGAPEASDEEVLAVLRALASALEARGREAPRERYLELVEKLFADSRSEIPDLDLPDGLDEPPPRLIVTP
ncbi:MAG: hypothetical protein ACRD3V_33345 [Vicinamibacteria bacterium]